MTIELTASKFAQGLILGLAVLAVALADIFIKKAAVEANLTQAVRSPWFWAAVGLYLLQIAVFTYAFVGGWKLSLIAAMQTALYALVVLAASILLYREAVTGVQALGILLAFGGVVLINWP
jgi:drug/metabolite transporter (DMT)-like permease